MGTGFLPNTFTQWLGPWRDPFGVTELVPKSPQRSFLGADRGGEFGHDVADGERACLAFAAVLMMSLMLGA